MTLSFFRRRIALSTLLLALLASSPFSLALDINTATAVELTQLKGVGPKRAEAIVRYREANGPFTSHEALLDVPGIGAKVLADNAKDIELSTRVSASVQ